MCVKIWMNIGKKLRFLYLLPKPLAVKTQPTDKTYFFCSFAQASFKPTVRLKINLSGVDSVSTQK